MNPPTREDFDRWRDDFVTRWILGACEIYATEQEAEWHRVSWINGGCSEKLLIELRTRADAYRALAETDYTAWLAANGQEEPRG